MALPKYFTDGPGKHKKSKAQERRIAKELGGKTQRGSGSKDFHKGDIKSVELLVEAKRTDKDSLSVKKEWLIKIFQESVSYSRIPALSIEFDDMPTIVPKDWIAIPAKTLKLLIDCYKVVMEEPVDDGDE